MTLEIKRKKLVDIEIPIWAEVKHFATLKELSINDAVQILLKVGLHNHGYKSPIDEQRIAVSSGESLTASNQNVSPAKIQ
jgi:hypothetical protein